MNEILSIENKWNDTDNYDISEPNWKQFIRFAKEIYEKNDKCLEYKDGMEVKSIPYILFTQNVLSIMNEELNIKSDFDRELCILGRLVAQVKIEEFEFCCATISREWVQYFIPADFAHLDKYLRSALICSPNGMEQKIINIIILTEALYYLRIEKCPNEDWRIDNEYYSSVESVLDTFGELVTNSSCALLVMKIKKQLCENKNISRNRNKTVEELFAGWED